MECQRVADQERVGTLERNVAAYNATLEAKELQITQHEQQRMTDVQRIKTLENEKGELKVNGGRVPKACHVAEFVAYPCRPFRALLFLLRRPLSLLSMLWTRRT